jgi:hypothetical protein
MGNSPLPEQHGREQEKNFDFATKLTLAVPLLNLKSAICNLKETGFL